MKLIRSFIPAIILFTGSIAAAQVAPAAPIAPGAPVTPEARAETELRAIERMNTPPTAPLPALAEAQSRLAALEAQVAAGVPTAPTAPAVAETQALLRAIELQQAPGAPQTPPSPAAPMAFYFNSDGGYLGIATGNVTDENASKLGLSEPRGVVIERVLDGSPAASAGLQKDDVILKFEGEEVTSVSKLTRLVGEVAPDHKVKMRISRAGHEQDINVTLGKRTGNMAWSGNLGNLGELGQLNGRALAPDSQEWRELQEKMGKMKLEGFPQGQGGNAVWTFGPGRRVGISTISLTKQLAEFFGVPSGQGVLITNVNENSPASKSGLKAGDVITEVDGDKVDDSGDVSRSLNKKAEGDVNLTVIRDRGQRMVTVTPEKGAAGFNGTFLKPSVFVQPRINGAMPRIAPVPGIRIPGGVGPARRTTVIL
jgi:membrane-associated protease RseP (regulator of RpoE activity)